MHPCTCTMDTFQLFSKKQKYVMQTNAEQRWRKGIKVRKMASKKKCITCIQIDFEWRVHGMHILYKLNRSIRTAKWTLCHCAHSEFAGKAAATQLQHWIKFSQREREHHQHSLVCVIFVFTIPIYMHRMYSHCHLLSHFPIFHHSP